MLNISFSFTAYEIINSEGGIVGKRNSSSSLNFKKLLNSCDIGLSTVIMKKDLIDDECKFPNLKTKEDYVLWLKIAKTKCDLYGINIFLTKWRQLGNSLSSSSLQKLLDSYRVYNKFMKFNFFNFLNASFNFNLSCLYLEKLMLENSCSIILVL